MKIASLIFLSLFLPALVLPPMAGEAATQQNKMKDCSEQAKAKGLGEGKGDGRQAFMKECLSAKSTKSGKPLNRRR